MFDNKANICVMLKELCTEKISFEMQSHHFPFTESRRKKAKNQATSIKKSVQTKNMRLPNLSSSRRRKDAGTRTGTTTPDTNRLCEGPLYPYLEFRTILRWASSDVELWKARR
ncbi:hypothetical protein TNIN_81331 [Trichonephila inaurata madagascariensis]|uniref:Uncharacterized protein n=1 Tax=Trichonephila inaurata madagascariensis TaxID=2747483 RepID=A0A8X6XXQ8_9ARAC|nr:hypothetical protein TNIN_81331 [Trichonephila inaurata madagascariensis]